MTQSMVISLFCHRIRCLRLIALMALTTALLLSIQLPCFALTLRVGVYPNKPLVYLDQDRVPQGLSIDVLRHVANQEGWQLEFVPGSWSQCLERLNRGEIDLQVAIAFSEEREKIYNFPEQTLITNWGRLYSHPDSVVESLLDLDGLPIALLENDIHSRVFLSLMEKFNQQVKPVFLNNYDEVLAAIEQHRVSAGVVNRMYAMQNAHRFDIKTTPMIFNPIEVRYAAPLGADPVILEIIDHYVAELRTNKTSIYYQSLEKWFGQDSPPRIPTWIITTLALSSTAILFIFAFTMFLKKQVSLKTAEANSANDQLKDQLAQLEQAQAALKESEQKYRAVLDHQQDCLLLHKYQTEGYSIFSDVNDTTVRFYGYSRKQLLGMTVENLIHPDKLKEHRDSGHKEKLFREKEIIIESVHIKKSGTSVPVEVSVSIVELAGETYILSAVRDITERKKAEEERLRLDEQIRQKFKMEAVGVLAGGVAHNFNNSLAIILGNLEMAQRKVTDPEKIVAYLENAQKAVLLSRSLIQQILTYSRKNSHEKKPVQLSAMVEDIIKLLRSTIPTTIELRFDQQVKQNTALILADPGQLHDVLINLCTNAVHAMDEKGALEIALEEKSLSRADIPTHLNHQHGPYVKLSVKDNGCGMPDYILEKIFDPFFTTKGINEGTGMGLSTVQGIVDQHNGFIKVDSQQGRGSCFELYFPVTEQEEEIISGKEEQSTAVSGSGKILLVDDEAMLLDLGEEILTMLGYNVTTEISSKRALEAIRTDPNKFDLVITDQSMPELSGKELSQEIAALNANIPIILCTGYSTQISEEDAGLFGITSYCAKPLKIEELSQAIKRAFELKSESVSGR